MQEFRQALDVVAGGHQCHRRRGTRLADGSDELAAHVPHLGKGMFHPGTGFGNTLVAPLLTLAQGHALLGLALDALAQAECAQNIAALAARIPAVGEHVGAGVAHVEHFFEVRAVVLAGGAGEDLADEFVLDVHAHAQLVAVVRLAMLLGVRGVQVLLSALGLAPVLGYLACIELRTLLPGEVLDVSAGIKMTHMVGIKVTHLRQAGGLLAADVDPGAESGNQSHGPQGPIHQADRARARNVAQHRAAPAARRRCGAIRPAGAAAYEAHAVLVVPARAH